MALLRVVFFILISTLYLHAIPTIQLDNRNINITQFEMEYYHDPICEVPIEYIKLKKFTKSPSEVSLGKGKDCTWYRFAITNTTDEKFELFFHDELAFLNRTKELYILEERKVIDHITVDMTNTEDIKKYMFGKDLVIPLTLNANQTKHIYYFNPVFDMQFVDLSIRCENHSKRSFIDGETFYLLSLGMLLSFALYHFILYILSGYKEYLYYTLYLTSAFTWEIFLTGMVATTFGIYSYGLVVYFLTLSVLLVPVFLVLFAQAIFNTKNYYPTEHKFLNSVTVIFLITFVLGIFDVHLAIRLAADLYFYAFIVILVTTFFIQKKGNPLAKFFLIGNILFAFFTLLTDLTYLGIISYSTFTFNAAIVGILLEAIVLSYILLYRIKILQQKEIAHVKKRIHEKEMRKMNKKLQQEVEVELEKSREKDKVIFQQNKMVSMGEMIQNIAHQWRQPLAQINSAVLILDHTVKKHKIYDENIDKQLGDIERCTKYMSQTISSFRDFFDQNKEQKHFCFNDAVEEALLLLKSTLSNAKIEVKHERYGYFPYYGYPDEFQQVLIILFNNAIDVLKTMHHKRPYIQIKIKRTQLNYIISVADNGGGIPLDIIEKVFDPYFTTKHKSRGTGLGLYIAKSIIEQHMGGTLIVKNTEEGALFSIYMPISDQLKHHLEKEQHAKNQ